MSAIGEKLHALLARIRGGEELAQHEVEAVVQELLQHFTPAFETIKSDVLNEFHAAVANAKAELEALVATLKTDVEGAVPAAPDETAPDAPETPAPAPAPETPADPPADASTPAV